ncbi:HD domain-containing protein [Benzoatithermus flavus]|uniref:HD domain-containing protein n=1 Tax=Benzoatithermus flavus TaxID=3108223 RepID=A0ABU8XXR5_9PROT
MNPSALTRATIVPFIADIFERRGAESYLGEAVSMSEHMLQGAVLAEREGAPEELVAAALLHDIGHYTNEFGEDYIEQGIDNLHDEAGARVLEPFFPPLVTECVRLHVAAKRYLCATEPSYFGRLSPASVATLRLQGGPMSADEVAAFERNPYWREAVRVRLWDEGGKVPGMATPPFSHYAPLLQRVVDRHLSAGAG